MIAFFLRPICGFIASGFVGLFAIGIPGLLLYTGDIGYYHAIGAWFAYITVSGLARKWLKTDSVTLRPYRPRMKHRQKRGPKPLAPPTVDLAIRTDATFDADYADMVARLPGPLNRMIGDSLKY